ncbi:hypothetical protein C8F01DRAFT_418241 [Mycena amicta]|nr:hypothetical protein C8F01DRAFT_418241 [Mycena amicta]
MDFTELYRYENTLSPSPDSRFIIAGFKSRLILRTTATFQIFQTWQIDQSPTPTSALLTGNKDKSAQDSISHIDWSCDSAYFLAASTKAGVVHVYKVEDVNWSARIESGTEGLVKAEWAPDGRTILCFSQWGLRVTIWSLVMLFVPTDAILFWLSGTNQRIRQACTTLKTQYKLVRHFPLPTSSMASLALSPSGNHFAVWEGVFFARL